MKSAVNRVKINRAKKYQMRGIVDYCWIVDKSGFIDQVMIEGEFIISDHKLRRNC